MAGIFLYLCLIKSLTRESGHHSEDRGEVLVVQWMLPVLGVRDHGNGNWISVCNSGVW